MLRCPSISVLSAGSSDAGSLDLGLGLRLRLVFAAGGGGVGVGGGWLTLICGDLGCELAETC